LPRNIPNKNYLEISARKQIPDLDNSAPKQILQHLSKNIPKRKIQKNISKTKIQKDTIIKERKTPISAISGGLSPVPSKFSRYSLGNKWIEDGDHKLHVGEESILKITEDSADLKVSGLSEILSPIGKLIPGKTHPIPSTQTNQHHSSLDELPQVYKAISKDLNTAIHGFPPSLSQTVSGLDFTPINNNLPNSFDTELRMQNPKSIGHSVFNTLSVDSPPKKDSPGINGTVSPIEVFPRVTLKPNSVSRGKKDDLSPDLEFPGLELPDLVDSAEIKPILHINLREPISSGEITYTKLGKLTPVHENTGSPLLGGVYNENGKRTDS
jgi:hypothetical protein